MLKFVNRVILGSVAFGLGRATGRKDDYNLGCQACRQVPEVLTVNAP